MTKIVSQPSEDICSSCNQSKPLLKRKYSCGLCNSVLCKECAFFSDENTFSFLRVVPDELKKDCYCAHCHEKILAPALASYADIKRRAQEVYIFEKGKKNIPLIKKSRIKVTVSDCEDKKEMFLRMAFFAAEQTYNAVMNVEVVYKKVRINGYQKTFWSASGYPALIRSAHLRDDIS